MRITKILLASLVVFSFANADSNEKQLSPADKAMKSWGDQLVKHDRQKAEEAKEKAGQKEQKNEFVSKSEIFNANKTSILELDGSTEGICDNINNKGCQEIINQECSDDKLEGMDKNECIKIITQTNTGNQQDRWLQDSMENLLIEFIKADDSVGMADFLQILQSKKISLYDIDLQKTIDEIIENKAVNVLNVMKQNYIDLNEAMIYDTNLLNYFKREKADNSLIEILEKR